MPSDDMTGLDLGLYSGQHLFSLHIRSKQIISRNLPLLFSFYDKIYVKV